MVSISAKMRRTIVHAFAGLVSIHSKNGEIFFQNFLHDQCWKGVKTKKSAGELSFLLSRAASRQRTR